MRKLSYLLILLGLVVALNAVYLPAAQAGMGQVVMGIDGMI